MIASAETHPIAQLATRFPQLYIPVEEGASASDTYRSVVLCGQNPGMLELRFGFSPEDTLAQVETPAGSVEVLYVKSRADFEHVVTCLAYRCEPREIPASMGALTLMRLNDWGKIRAHQREWLAQGNSSLYWAQEFKAFTADRANIASTLVVLSAGPYSAVPAAVAGYDEASWARHSHAIRKYHELAHVVSRRLYLENKESVRDEVLADYVGLVAAFGRYDARLALTFLGLESEGVREGGRLANYVSEDGSLEDAAVRARGLVELFAQFDGGCKADGQDSTARCFAALQAIETQRLGV